VIIKLVKAIHCKTLYFLYIREEIGQFGPYTVSFNRKTRRLRIGCQEHSIDSIFWEQAAYSVGKQFGTMWEEFVRHDGIEKVCAAIIEEIEE
jgi:hypothetical protein